MAMSLTAYAKRRGVSQVAVTKAVASGRLSACVERDPSGAPKIADPDLADREWEANTQPRADRKAPAVMPDDVPDYNTSRAIREAAAARREAALADMAEMDVAEKRGELVPTEEARAYMVDQFTIVKTKILGVPARIAQRLPHLSAEVAPIADELLREVLEELAAGSDDGEEEEDD